MSLLAERCHSWRNDVIPSAARNLSALQSGCYVRFFTSLRSVQNDKMRGRYVQKGKMRVAPFRMTDCGGAMFGTTEFGGALLRSE